MRSLAPSIWGVSAKTMVAAPAGGAAAAAGATFCNATICAWSMVMMAMSLAVVGAGAAMFA
jgi:hypothetical protein